MSCYDFLMSFENRHLKNLACEVIKTWKHTHSHILLYFGCLSSVFIKNLKFSDRPAEAGSIHRLTGSDGDHVALEMDAFNHVLDLDRDGDGRGLELVPNRLVESCFISDNDAEVEILHCLVVHFLERQSQHYCRGSGAHEHTQRDKLGTQLHGQSTVTPTATSCKSC